MRSTRAITWAAALAGGVALALPFLHPAFTPLLPFGVLPWLVLLCEPRRPGLLPAVACGGLLYSVIVFHWLAEIHVFVWMLAAFYAATPFPVFAWAFHRARARLKLPAVVLAPVLWCALELALQVLGPFKTQWLNVGLGLVNVSPLAQLAEVTGVTGLSALVMLVAGAMTDALVAWREGGRIALRQPRAWAGLAAALAVVAIVAIVGAWRMSEIALTPGAKVALVQAAVPQDARNMTKNIPAVFLRHESLTKGADLDDVALVSWSESTLMVVLEKEQAWWTAVSGLTRELGKPLLLGAVGLGRYPEGDEAPTNSAFLVGVNGLVQARWDKRALVPPAETMLWIDRWPAMRMKLGKIFRERFHFNPYFVPGRAGVVTPIADADLRVGAMVCYDSAVPGPSDDLRAAGANVLIILTNEAWFGSGEKSQLLNLARLRAIENRLPVLRAGNTGATVSIDPLGRVREELAPDVPAVLIATPWKTTVSAPPRWAQALFPAALGLAAIALVGLTYMPKWRLTPGTEPDAPSRARERAVASSARRPRSLRAAR